MDSEEEAEHLRISDDAEARANFLGLISDHQRAISDMITTLSAREEFGHTKAQHVFAAMRRSVADFEITASRLSEFCDNNTGMP